MNYDDSFLFGDFCPGLYKIHCCLDGIRCLLQWYQGLLHLIHSHREYTSPLLFSRPIKKIARNKIDYNVTVTGTKNEHNWNLNCVTEISSPKTNAVQWSFYLISWILWCLALSRTHTTYTIRFIAFLWCQLRYQMIAREKFKEATIMPCVCIVSILESLSVKQVSRVNWNGVDLVTFW